MIPLTLLNGDSIWVRSDSIDSIQKDEDGSLLHVRSGDSYRVKEAPNLIMNLNQFY